MEFYALVVTGHVFFVVVALGAHGASALAMVAAQREADRARLAAILDLSFRAFSAASLALAAAVLLGIAATIMGNHGGRLWVWLSIGVLVALMVLMGPLAGTSGTDRARTRTTCACGTASSTRRAPRSVRARSRRSVSAGRSSWSGSWRSSPGERD